MTTRWPRSYSFLPVLALSLSAFPAVASEVICDGAMRLADCTPVGPMSWPASSQPTFTAKCKPCPSPIPGLDGGASACGPWEPADPRQFMISGPNTTPGTHPLDFEEAGACGGETLFRYVGPLVAGDYEIRLNSNGHSNELRFTVVDAIPQPGAGAIAPDAGASAPDAGAAADVGSGVDGAAARDADPGSCACVAVRGRDGGLLTLVVLGFVGVIAARRASPQQRGSTTRLSAARWVVRWRRGDRRSKRR